MVQRIVKLALPLFSALKNLCCHFFFGAGRVGRGQFRLEMNMVIVLEACGIYSNYYSKVFMCAFRISMRLNVIHKSKNNNV